MFLAAPIVFGGFLLLAGLMVVVLGRFGGSASGERLTIVFSVSCPDGNGGGGPGSGIPGDTVLGAAELATGRVINARAIEIGLGEPHLSQSKGTLSVTATMPGLPDDHDAVPALLARPGTLEFRHQGVVIASRTDLVEARMRLDESGLPVTDLVLASSTVAALTDRLSQDPEGTMIIALDGDVVAERPNSISIAGDAIMLPSGEGMTRDRMRRAADRGIVLNHGPLPCTLDLISVAPPTSPSGT